MAGRAMQAQRAVRLRCTICPLCPFTLHLRRAARSFFAEAVSTTLRKPFDAWQASLVQQVSISLVALTALRQSLLFVGSPKQDASDKAAVADAVAAVIGSIMQTAGSGAHALACVLAAALPATQPAAGKKRKAGHDHGLPPEAASLAQLLQTVELLCSGTRKRPAHSKLATPVLEGDCVVVTVVNAAMALRSQGT